MVTARKHRDTTRTLLYSTLLADIGNRIAREVLAG